MNTMTTDALLTSLRWRYAVKKFDPARKIPAETWSALEQAVVLSPSSYGLQPWKFLVITNPDVRAKLRPVSWNQSQITDASHLVVFTRKTSMDAAYIQRYIDRIVQVRNVPAAALDGYKNMMVGSLVSPPPKFEIGEWAARQVYIALGVFLSAAAMLGVDACPMEGFESPKYDEILGLNGTGYSSTVLATAGYRAADDPFAAMAKVRHDLGDAITQI
jgi:nitroreductase